MIIKRFPVRHNPLLVANPHKGHRKGKRKGHKKSGFARLVHNPKAALKSFLRSPLAVLKNPGEVQIAGIQVVPLVGGAVGAIVVENICTQVPFLANLGGKDSAVSKAVPLVAGVAAGLAVHKFVKHPMAKAIGANIAALSIVFAVRRLAEESIRKAVASVVAKVSPKAAATTAVSTAVEKQAEAVKAAGEAQTVLKGLSGGGFLGKGAAGLSGGGFLGKGAAGLSGGGFMSNKGMSGGAFKALNKPYTPIEGSDLSGFMLNGRLSGSNGLTASAGRAVGTLKGLDLTDFAS